MYSARLPAYHERASLLLHECVSAWCAYYSADNGSSWRRLDNDAVAAINNSWIIDEDQNGNSRLTGTNKIGAVIATGSAGSGTTPPSGGDTPSGDNNHSFANAIDLGTDSAIRAFANGSIPQAYEEDYYRFTLTRSASITWTTSGASGDTMIYLYDSNQNQIAYNDDGGDGLFSQLALELDAGTYYIKVKAWSSGTVADYTLTPTIAGATADALTVTTAADVVDAFFIKYCDGVLDRIEMEISQVVVCEDRAIEASRLEKVNVFGLAAKVGAAFCDRKANALLAKHVFLVYDAEIRRFEHGDDLGDGCLGNCAAHLGCMMGADITRENKLHSSLSFGVFIRNLSITEGMRKVKRREEKSVSPFSIAPI